MFGKSFGKKFLNPIIWYIKLFSKSNTSREINFHNCYIISITSLAGKRHFLFTAEGHESFYCRHTEISRMYQTSLPGCDFNPLFIPFSLPFQKLAALCMATVSLENCRTISALWYIRICLLEFLAELRKIKIKNVTSFPIKTT